MAVANVIPPVQEYPVHDPSVVDEIFFENITASVESGIQRLDHLLTEAETNRNAAIKVNEDFDRLLVSTIPIYDPKGKLIDTLKMSEIQKTAFIANTVADYNSFFDCMDQHKYTISKLDKCRESVSDYQKYAAKILGVSMSQRATTASGAETTKLEHRITQQTAWVFQMNNYAHKLETLKERLVLRLRDESKAVGAFYRGLNNAIQGSGMLMRFGRRVASSAGRIEYVDPNAAEASEASAGPEERSEPGSPSSPQYKDARTQEAEEKSSGGGVAAPARAVAAAETTHGGAKPNAKIRQRKTKKKPV